MSIARRLRGAVEPGILVGGVGAFALSYLLARAWSTCDVGINDAANSLELLFGLPCLWAVNTTMFVIVHAALSGETRGRQLLALAAGTAAVLVLGVELFAWQGTPGTYPDPICPGNIPPWWPSWIPT
ncbi:hypothetical protein ACPA54_13460 [Uniformispora flossi]|uniref:hypothetical protein n=1 Tax=Uniformispora flossi TaxID=3390723 RepID=UPI003C2E7785